MSSKCADSSTPLHSAQNDILVTLFVFTIRLLKADSLKLKMCDGKFNDGGFFEVERPHDVTVLSCELRYRIDTKGFYQPVYLFELSSEDGSYNDWIMIPAMK